MKRYFPFLIIALVAAGAVGGGALFYRAKVASLTPTAKASVAKSEEPGDRGRTHIRGSAEASVTLEEFGDFQCPPCSIVAASLLKVEHEFGDKLRVIFRNFPLAVHAHAAEAARAAEAAGLQGKFWEMHDLLFKNQPLWSKDAEARLSFMNYAEEIGLDLGRFEKDMDSPEVRERVAADQERGKSLGVTSTPTLFINGQGLPPAQMNEPALRAALAAAVRGENPIQSPSPTPAAPAIPLAPPEAPAASALPTTTPQP